MALASAREARIRGNACRNMIAGREGDAVANFTDLPGVPQ
jgi:hypothetical protein